MRGLSGLSSRLSGLGTAGGAAPPPDPPVPVSATVLTNSTFSVTFDRDITVTDTSAWTVISLFNPSIAIDTIASVAGATVTFNVTGGNFILEDVVTVSYDGTGDAAGSPDGVPVEAFTDFPVANPL